VATGDQNSRARGVKKAKSPRSYRGLAASHEFSAAGGNAHLKVRELECALVVKRAGRFRDLVPITGATAFTPAAVDFHFALALDAGRREWQGIKSRNRNLACAAFTRTIAALLESNERPFDLAQLARFQLGNLRGYFFACGIEGEIGSIGAYARAAIVQVFQISTQPIPQLLPASDQGVMQAE
jgi:hypothetical protein